MPASARYPFRGFSRPTYTQVPDELFDELLADLPGAELKVLLYIVRRTFGFKKDADAISLAQFVHGIQTRDRRVLDRGVGLSKATVARALQHLAERGIIATERQRSDERGDQPTLYRLRFADDPVSQPRDTPCLTDETPPVLTLQPALSHTRDTQQTASQQTEPARRPRQRATKQQPPQLPLRDPLPVLPEAPEAVWDDVLALLREQASPANFTTYLADTQLVALTTESATIQAPNRHQADWLAKRWPALIERALAARLGRKVRCRVVSRGA